PSWVSCLPPVSTARVLQNEVWIGAGCHLLEGCLPQLVAAASEDGQRRAASFRVLSRFLHHGARAALRDLAGSSSPAAVAVGQTGDPEADPTLLGALQRRDASEPDLLRMLARFPSRDTARVVRRKLSASDPDLRAAAATAIEGFGELDPVGLARPLLSGRD